MCLAPLLAAVTMIRYKLFLLLVSVVPMTVIAAHREPWIEIGVDGAMRGNPDEYPVFLVSIDGSMDFRNEFTQTLAPGLHAFDVSTTKKDSSGLLTYQRVTINTKPCVRYELVANHAHPIENRSWQILIKSELPITRCMEKFGIVPVTHSRVATSDSASSQ